jgi:hypothetical protein
MLKIDIDEYSHRYRFELQKILHAMPCPFFVRLSSSRTGLHIAVPLCDEWDFRRIAYDDRMRIDLDTQRELHKLPVKNLLWDVKNGLPAGRWRIVRNSKECEDFIDSLTERPLYAHRAHIYLSQKLKALGCEQNEGIRI